MSYPYQTPPPAPGYGDYHVSPPSSGAAVAALVLGILALLTTWIPFFGLFLLVLSVAAIVVGIAALVQVSRGRARGRGMAITGLVLGLLSVVICVLVHVLVYRAASSIVDEVSSSYSSASAAATSASTASGSPTTAGEGGSTKSEAGADVSLGTPSTGSMITLPVTVTNTTSEQASFTAEIEVVVDGDVAATTRVMAIAVEPGASTTRTAMVGADRDLSDATYRVGEVTKLGGDVPDPREFPLPTQN